MNNQLLDSKGDIMKKKNYYTVFGFKNLKYVGTLSSNNMLMRFLTPSRNAFRIIYNPEAPPIPNEKKDNEDYNTDIEDDSDNDFQGGKGKRRKSIRRRKSIKKGRKSIRRRK
jgi:hypothetical protein